MASMSSTIEYNARIPVARPSGVDHVECLVRVHYTNEGGPGRVEVEPEMPDVAFDFLCQSLHGQWGPLGIVGVQRDLQSTTAIFPERVFLDPVPWGRNVEFVIPRGG